MPPGAVARRSPCPAISPGARRATRAALPARSAHGRGDRRRHARGGDAAHGARLRALIVLLWRAGLRINEALTVSEQDLEPRAGSVLVRHGKGGRRREVGMDRWGWEQLSPWLELRVTMPVGPLLCVIDGPTRGRSWASDAARAQLRRVASKAGVRRRFAPHQLRHAHAVELAHEGVPLNVIQRQLGAHQPRRHLDLSARDRQRRDHRHRPCAKDTDDPRQHRTPLLGPGPVHADVTTGRTVLVASRSSRDMYGMPQHLGAIPPRG
jgi:integrase